MKLRSVLVFLSLSLFVSTVIRAETVADREGSVRQDKAKLENDPRWIYNDWEKGLAEGKRTGKPVLVVLRCVPCLACAGIDAKVLLENEELTPLLDQFVCVRVINANALDLSIFQFDNDLSFSTLIFNGDRTLYGRYGSWKHQRDPREETTAGFRRALEAALEIHENYPANKKSLSGKQGKPSPYETPADIPRLAKTKKYTRSLEWDGELLKSCIHCHQIGDSLRAGFRSQNVTIPSNLVFPFPAPETIGLKLAAGDIARVVSIIDDSPAAAAGLKPGDELVELNRQPLISQADLSWVLHNTPDKGSVTAKLERDGTTKTVKMKLPAGWRNHSDISRRVGTWEMRAMALGGIYLEDLSDEDRAKQGLDNTQLALFAKHVGQYNKHAAAKRAGFINGDIIIEIDGVDRRLTEGELIGRLLEKYQPGDKIKATVLRDGKRHHFTLPMQ